MTPWIHSLEQRRLLAIVPAGFSDTAWGSAYGQTTTMQFAPDGRLFVARQNGELHIINASGTSLGAAIDLNVDSTGERGLLGIAFDPSFASNGYIYLYYTVPSPLHNRISRFTVSGNTIAAASEVILMDLQNLNAAATNHNGGALHIGPDGKLYVAVGENADPVKSQQLTTTFGKMLRMNLDGTIPSDNPYYADTSGINQSIWAMGLRNPYTFAFQSGTGRMFINDVGQGTWEEINDGIAGANYGWPDTEGPFNQAAFPNYTHPLHSYDPSGASAITGGAFYNPAVNSPYPLNYVGKYFFADYSNGFVKYIDPNSPPANNAASGFATGFAQPVDVEVGPDGFLYVLTRNGGVRRITTAPLSYTQQQLMILPYVPASGIAHVMRFVFNRDVAGSISAGDLMLTDPISDNPVLTGQITLNYNATTRTADFRFNGNSRGILPDGNYRAVLPTGSVDDGNDIPTTTAGQINFFILAGDGNADRRVNSIDFNLLAGRFGQTVSTPAFGDFDYSGDVDSQDATLLFGQYGKSLQVPGTAAIPASALFATQTIQETDQVLFASQC